MRRALDQLWIGFGQSRETSDFISDSLDRWWDGRSKIHRRIKRIQINLGNGPGISSSRTQFMNRLVPFADRKGLGIELVYYPPYHSKYNPIERCWGIVESHWNGAMLSTVQVALNWAATMKWRGVAPIVELVEGVYERGVTIVKNRVPSNPCPPRKSNEPEKNGRSSSKQNRLVIDHRLPLADLFEIHSLHSRPDRLQFWLGLGMFSSPLNPTGS